MKNLPRLLSDWSRISQGGGVPTVEAGLPTYDLAKFLLKTASKWKNLDWEGGASLVPPLGSATVALAVLFIEMTKFS